MKLVNLCFFVIVSMVGYAHAQDVNETNATSESVEQPVEWVVVLDDPRPKRLQGWQRTGYRGGNNYLNAIELERFGDRVAKQYHLALQDQWLIESLGVYCLIVRFEQDQEQTIQALKKDKGVQWVQPSNDFNLLAPNTRAVPSSIDNEQRATPTITGLGVTIAVIDSAVDSMHQDIAPAIQQTVDFVVGGEQAQVSGEAHGTAIAGVIAAQSSTKLGITGVAPDAKLLAFRGCWETEGGETNCNTLSLARALNAVAQSEADILNLSLSGPKDRLLDQLVNRITNNGTMVVAAFDPQRQANQRFPSDSLGVLIVRAEGMNTEIQGVFTAPGSRVVTSPGNGYEYKSGHSIATAYTSGTLALRRQAQSGGVSRIEAKADWRHISNLNKANDLVDGLLKDSTRVNRDPILVPRYLVVSD